MHKQIRTTMPVIDPIYSIEKDCEVYHNHTECTERNNIETKNVRAGTGDKRLCHHCLKLSANLPLWPKMGLSINPLIAAGKIVKK